jgi:hypothetical protein
VRVDKYSHEEGACLIWFCHATLLGATIWLFYKTTRHDVKRTISSAAQRIGATCTNTPGRQHRAAGGYGKIYATGRVDEALCWAHARRPFQDLYENQGRVAGSIAEQALQHIAALYAIEAQIRGQPP